MSQTTPQIDVFAHPYLQPQVVVLSYHLRTQHMELFNLDRDINTLYVQASSFPDGIGEAYHRLGALGPDFHARTYYGISFMGENGEIIYRAAAEESFEGEAKQLGCETFLIKKGTYVSKYIRVFHDNIPEMGKTFQEMVRDPRIDQNGACIEVYDHEGGTENVRCMVRLDPAKI